MNKLHRSTGHTLLEMLIALFLSGIIMTAGYSFYITMHNQVLTQDEISEMQQRSRATLQELGGTLRMAGYRVGSHDAYDINGDSLVVYFNDTQPIDTVSYFLVEDTEARLTGSEAFFLMRQHNSESAQIFCDYVQSMSFNIVSASEIEVTLVMQATKPDETFTENDGVRILAMTERVSIRNVGL